MVRFRWLFILALIFGVAGHSHPSFAQDVQEGSGKTFLHKNWQLQSSCEVKARGEQVSTTGFDASKWHKTDIPSTVVGALVNDKTYPDPTVAKNFKSLPGM